MFRFAHLLLALLLVGGAAAQEFPFKNGPLDPSLHSNKIFFQNISIHDVAGVWDATNYMGYQLLDSLSLRGGDIPLNEICQRARDAGILYSWPKQWPQSEIVVPDSDVEGQVGQFFTALGFGHRPKGIVEVMDDRMVFDDESCYIWRPYFDWEIGRPMYLRNRRIFMWVEDDGEFVIHSGGDFCVYGGVDYPYCEETSFIVEGQEKQGVVMDTLYYYECSAGPCLELPHTLPGFVKTQGWQPRN